MNDLPADIVWRIMVQCYHANIAAFWALCRTCRAFCDTGAAICRADGIARADLHWVVWGLFTEPQYLHGKRNITSTGPQRYNACAPRHIYWHLPAGCINLSTVPLTFCATVVHANAHCISVCCPSIHLNEFSRLLEAQSELLAIEYVPMYHSRFILSYDGADFSDGDTVQITAKLYVKGMWPARIVLVWQICAVVAICPPEYTG
jgi:hypothetical protein